MNAGRRTLLRNLRPACIYNIQFAKMSTKKIVAVCQMTATDDKEKNLSDCKALVAHAKQLNAQVVFLPEACDYIGKSTKQTVEMAEDVISGPTISAFKDLARQHKVWLSLGGMHEKVDDKTVRNVHILLNAEGEIMASYAKLHLFDVHIEERNVILKESSYCKPGESVVPPVPTPVGNLGLSVCYDIRFPELSLSLRMQGADILTYPSAFTMATGAAHWETLLRARAIETQCYVIAAAQCGSHNPRRESWGHAMIVDPWGTIIAQCSNGTNVAVAEIDHGFLNITRTEMPVLQHRRNDIYPSLKPSSIVYPSDDIDSKDFKFGQVVVKGSGIFAKTNLSMAFTNKKCVVPGHVLVAPFRCVPRMSELTQEEVADLFKLVHRVAPVVESYYHGTSVSTVVQDGKDAGQTIQHVHVHIVPRRPGDYLDNDDIYKDLARHNKEDSTIGRRRSYEEMAAEARILRERMKEMC